MLTSQAMRGSQRNTLQTPWEYTLFFTGLPSALLPLLSPQLRWSNHRAAGGQGCEEAHASHDGTPPDGNPPKHKYRPQGPSSPTPSLPVPRALQSTVHCSPFLESTHAKVSFLLHHLLLLPKESKCRLKTTDHCHSMPTKRKHNSLEIHAEVATATVPQPNSRHQPLNASMLQRLPGQGGLPCLFSPLRTLFGHLQHHSYPCSQPSNSQLTTLETSPDSSFSWRAGRCQPGKSVSS